MATDTCINIVLMLDLDGFGKLLFNIYSWKKFLKNAGYQSVSFM